MLIAMLALVAIVGAALFSLSSFRDVGDRDDRTAAARPGTTDFSVEPAMDEDLSTPTRSAPDLVEPAVFQPAPATTEPEAALPTPAIRPGAEPPTIPPPRLRPDTRPESQDLAALDAADAARPERPTPAGGSSAGATVRAFYSALSRGDGASAAQLVVPAKRQSGPLSGAALTRYFSSFRRPLRVQRVTPVDENTVRVAYDYTLGDGRVCQGEATVNVVQSGGRGLVNGIRTRGPC